LPTGEHILTFECIPGGGATFTVAPQNFRFLQLPFSQGLYAGRWMLLAELKCDPSQVKVSTTPGLSLDFTRLPS
jgi:hypothetical protein